MVVTEDNYETTVQLAEAFVLDVYAEWCSPCKKTAPIFASLSQEYQGRYTFGKLNSEQNANLVKTLKVKGLPTIIFYKNGKEVGRTVGYHSEEELKGIIEKKLGS